VSTTAIRTAIRTFLLPRAALAVTESGKVHAAFVYETDARGSRKVRIAVRIAVVDTPPMRYPFALTRSSKNPAEARRFLSYLASPEAKKVFVKYGFIVFAGGGKMLGASN